MSESREDLPKLVAVITVTASKLALTSGFAYLRMKRRARKSSRRFESGLLDNGIPPEMARDLALKYETDLSIRRMMTSFGGNFTIWGRGK